MAEQRNDVRALDANVAPPPPPLAAEIFSAEQALAELKQQARRLAEAAPPRSRLSYAHAFCAAVLGRYWVALHGRRAPAMPAPAVASRRLKRDALAVAVAIGEGAALLPVEDAAYLVGSTYAAMLPADVRSDRGVYYTPPPVVGRLLDAVTAQGVDWKTCRVLDPACGGGAFLGPLAARMVASLGGSNRRAIVRNVAARLRGLEIDPFAAWMSQVFLQATLFELLGAGAAEIGAPITVCDALAHEGAEDFDLVIGNPPYGRVTLTSRQREQYRRSLFGHANLYGVFLDFAVRRTARTGLIAYVTPTSFLSGEYYKRLRALLVREAPPVELDFVSERAGVFDDVLQETLLAVYRKGEQRREPRVNFVNVDRSAVAVSPAGNVSLADEPEAPWIIPRSLATAKLAQRLADFPARLSDWGYRVSTGPLVWNRHKSQLRQKNEPGAVPLIWAEAVGADGTFSFRAARRNHAPYFAIQEDDQWLLVTRPCVLLQRTTAKEQPRRLIAAELPKEFLDRHASVTVENHLNMLVPAGEGAAVDTATLAAFLNSSIADQVFRCINGSVAVSAYELESMPLPAPEALSKLTALVQEGAPRIRVEALCARLYE